MGEESGSVKLSQTTLEVPLCAMAQHQSGNVGALRS